VALATLRKKTPGSPPSDAISQVARPSRPSYVIRVVTLQLGLRKRPTIIVNRDFPFGLTGQKNVYMHPAQFALLPIPSAQHSSPQMPHPPSPKDYPSSGSPPSDPASPCRAPFSSNPPAQQISPRMSPFFPAEAGDLAGQLMLQPPTPPP